MPVEATSPQAGTKRAHETDEASTTTVASLNEKENVPSPPVNTASATSAFRNVSACNRCRARKNRCDQNLPACAACTKAGVRCVGYDPITKREIPRSYVYFLETRLKYFESLLVKNGIAFDVAETFDADSRVLGADAGHNDSHVNIEPASLQAVGRKDTTSENTDRDNDNKHDDDKLDNLVSNIGMVSVHGASNNRYLGSTSGISFARVVLSAVKKAAPNSHGDKGGTRSRGSMSAGSGTSMRETYFGLQTKPTIKEAPFPDRELGHKLLTLYFEHANPQIPILHRDEFYDMFEKAYNVEHDARTPTQLYFLNIVFAIGSGIIWGSSDNDAVPSEYTAKRAKLSVQQAQPEEYHASAIVHLSGVLSSTTHDAEAGGDLQELQAVLLLAGFALLRPIAPGLWYIVGVAMRIAIDLGLHYEEGSGLNEAELIHRPGSGLNARKARQVGRRQYIRDLRRRLWWCTYTFDRLVSTCVGRPFGITDQVITTEFPSLLDDKHITVGGVSHVVPSTEPSYKRVAHHYFRLRLLQSEIVQVLQYEQARIARLKGWNRHNDFIHKRLPSPFLIQFRSFRSWRQDIDQRLFEWKESAPAKSETGVAFSPQFLELNYWQAVTMLYRQSLSVPPAFAGQMSPTDDVTSPSSIMAEDKDDEDLVFLKCAEAGQRTLKIYRQLHRQRLVNYTYLATHHLFMAGISFLYAVWHSAVVRSRITLDDFDFTVLAATSVLDDLSTKCPPAQACREAFERMSKATEQMCMSTPGFGFGTGATNSDATSNHINIAPMPSPVSRRSDMQPPRKRPPPRFDMNLQELFPDVSPSMDRSSAASRPRANAQRPFRQARIPHTRRISVTSQPMTSDMTMQDEESAMHALAPNYESMLQNEAMQGQNAAATGFAVDPGSNSYNPDFLSNLLPGVDILSNLNINGRLGEAGPSNVAGQQFPGQWQSHAEEATDETWLDMEQTPNTDGDAESEWGYGSGFGVGVGMGLDFGPQHDWSDGQGGFNLFDGFFFGGDDGSSNM